MDRLDPALYKIAWIAPLEIEAQAALHMLDHRHRGRFPVSRGDDYVFQAGDINGHNIIIATLPESQEYGTGSAAALASQVKKFFPNLWFGLLVGIAAGLPNLDKDPPLDIRLGDVLVGLPEGESAGLIAYELGKETATGFQPLRLGRVLANTETVVRSAIGSIKMMAPNDIDEFLPLYETIKDKQHPRGTFQDPGQEKDILYRADSDGFFHVVTRGERSANNRTRVWYGPIGSGDKLVKNAERRNELRDRYNIIGLEMEAAGTMNRIPVGVIRGVCDYGDEHKNKDWQPYAAAMAAAYAKAVLYHLGPGDAVSQQSDICEVPPSPLKGAILCELPPKTDCFFGRESELHDMAKYLEQPSEVQKGVILCGISGSGKTQLAHEYVAQRRLQFSAILWIDAGSETSIEQSFASCFESICKQVPGVRAQGQKTSPRAFVLDWLRNTLNKNWLVVIDRANDPIPNRNLLEPFMKLPHGAVCVTSTHKAIARLLKRAQILVERLDRVSAQALLLWRASTGNEELTQEDYDAARQAAKVLDGFPLGLELAGILIHEGIMLLGSFEQDFTKKYKRLAQFQVDPGMWMWDTSDSLFSMFDALYKSLVTKNPQTGHLLSLCSVYGPWSIPISLLHGLELHKCQDSVEEIDPSSQLQALVDNDVELKLAIHELERLFLVKKISDANSNVISISLHASLCQWRLASMGEGGAGWIMQASQGLARHIQFQKARTGKSTQHRSDVDAAHRLSNLTNHCLDAISKYVHESDLSPPGGRFASQFFTFSSHAAELYLSLGKRETAKKLFSAAISHMRTIQVEELGNSDLMHLLRGFATCCSKTGDLIQAEEALKSALVIAETTLGHMSDEAIEIASRLRAVSESIATELDHSKRALVASTGDKLSRLDGRLESDNLGPSSMISPSRTTTRKSGAGSARLKSETEFENGVECQLLLVNPTVVLRRFGFIEILEGGIRLQVSKPVQIKTVTITLRCWLIAPITSQEPLEDNDSAQVLWSEEKHLPLQEFREFDLKSEARGTPQTRPGLKSLLERVQDRSSYFRSFRRGIYTCPFEFGLNYGLQPTESVGVLREVRWSLHATFRKPRPFAAPILERSCSICVLKESASSLVRFENKTVERRWEKQMLKITVSGKGGKALFSGTPMPVQVHFSNFDGFPRPFSLSFALVQVEDWWPRTSPGPLSFPGRLPLSDIPGWTDFRNAFWITIASQTDSMPVVRIIDLQLPTCKQMRQAGYAPLRPASSGAPLVNRALEVTLGSVSPVSGTERFEVLGKLTVPVTILDCRLDPQIRLPDNYEARLMGASGVLSSPSCGCYDADVSHLRYSLIPRPENIELCQVLLDLVPPEANLEPTGVHETTRSDEGEREETASQSLHPRRSISTGPGRVAQDDTASIPLVPPDYGPTTKTERNDRHDDDSFNSRDSNTEPQW